MNANTSWNGAASDRAAALFEESQDNLHRRADRLFANLMVLQWLAGIIAAAWISPKTWLGATSQTHWHVWAAIFLGGAISGFPIFMIWKQPGRVLTRHVVAVAQTLTSALLIHLTGGRIETHFHVFGSLAFLAVYRDWRVLVTATIVVAADHFARGMFWPQSVFGVLTSSPWRWIEHAGWVVFEDTVLFISIRQSLREMFQVAAHRAKLESVNADIEHQVAERTAELTLAHKELQTSEQRFRMLSASAPIGIFEADAAGANLYSNPQWEKITGLPPAGTTGQGWERVIHPEDAAEVFAGWSAATGQGQEFDREFRLLTTTGEVRWVHSRSAPVRSEVGGLIGHVGTVEDITERKRAQETLSQQARLAALGAEIGVALTRQKDLREILHQCVESIVGRLGAAFARIWTLNHRENVLELQASAGLYTHLDGPHGRVPVGKFKIGLIAQERKPHLTNSVVGDPRVGDQEWAKREGMVAFAGYPLLVGDQVVGVMAMFSRQPLAESTLQALASIADGIALGVVRKQAEEDREKFFALVENSTDFIGMATLDGKPLHLNMAGRKLVGLSTDEDLHSTSLAEYYDPETWKTIRDQVIPATIATGRWEGETRLRNVTTGQLIDVQMHTFLVRHPQTNEPICLAAVKRDITERKQAEAQIDKAHKELLEASRLAGRAEVATGVLHNVGNVLNSVNVSATLIADQVRKSKSSSLGKLAALLREHAAELGAFLTTDPRGRQLPGYVGQLSEHLAGEQQSLLQEAEALRKNIEHIKEIVAMQQNYAKVSGVAEIVKVSELVEDALRMNDGAMTRHEVQVIREFEDVPPITVDRHKAFQILINLLRNAKYACDDSGRLDKQITIAVANGDGRVQVVVSDNGIGIPAENLTRIFAHGFTTRKDGHGYGLHSGALAAKEIGGSLIAHSDGPGKGATFTLELPLQLPAKFDA